MAISESSPAESGGSDAEQQQPAAVNKPPPLAMPAAEEGIPGRSASNESLNLSPLSKEGGSGSGSRRNSSNARMAAFRALSRTSNNASPSDDLAQGFAPAVNEMDRYMADFNGKTMLAFQRTVQEEESTKRTTVLGLTDFCPYIKNGVEAIVNDSFTQCFQSKPDYHWNYAWYIAILYGLGVVVRYGVLLPIRIGIMATGMLLLTLMFCYSWLRPKEIRLAIQLKGVTMLAQTFLLSYCAVVRNHGQPPSRQPGQIYVANHSTVLDIVLLLAHQPYSLTGQAHKGVIGFFQDRVLAPMGNLWFDRMASADRKKVAEQIKAHAADVSKPPLLVFPEGTCVNNEYVVMFKRGAFELGDSIVPVAIKYNKIFVDAYWNSRAQSFPMHLFKMWTSWAVVCDVYFLDPQYREQGESSIEFAARVKELIAKTANLKSVPWDGYLKYFRPKEEFKTQRKELYTNILQYRFAELQEKQQEGQQDEAVDNPMRLETGARRRTISARI